MAQQEKNFIYRVTGIGELSYATTIQIEPVAGPDIKPVTVVCKCPWRFDEVLRFEKPRTEAEVLGALRAPLKGYWVGSVQGLSVKDLTKHPPEDPQDTPKK